MQQRTKKTHCCVLIARKLIFYKLKKSCFMNKKKLIFYVSVLVIWLFFRNFPHHTEVIYSRGLYPYLAKSLHFMLGWLPFSAGDVFYTLLIAFAIYFLIKNGKSVVKRPVWFLDKVCLFLTMLVFGFFLLWGFNYFRVSLANSLEIDTSYTEEELFTTVETYLQEANKLHNQLALNDTLKVDYTLTKQQIYDTAFKSYPLREYNLSCFSSTQNVKTSIYSTFLTYMGYSGYINPFTNEAQVNGKMIGYAVPVTACHEIAHQMGYAAEEEANYLGYLAARNSNDMYFKYSACLFALRYLLNETYKVNPEKYELFLSKLNKGIVKNYTEVRDFWRKYENQAEPIFKNVYDSFLKANKQSQGIQSYNLVVGLLIKNR